MTFWQEVNNRVSDHLISSGGKLNGKYIQNLECPSCGNLEAYANASKPSALYCNRKNKCGSTTDIDARIIVPDLFQDFHKNEGKGILYESLGFLTEENLTHLFTCNDRIKRIITAYKISSFQNSCLPTFVESGRFCQLEGL